MGEHIDRPVRVVSYRRWCSRPQIGGSTVDKTLQAIAGASGFIGQAHLEHVLQEKDCGKFLEIECQSPL
jgi:hypothetical protein